jgi:hypothetical protein
MLRPTIPGSLLSLLLSLLANWMRLYIVAQIIAQLILRGKFTPCGHAIFPEQVYLYGRDYKSSEWKNDWEMGQA